MALIYKKLRYPPKADGSAGDVRTDIIGGDITDDNNVVVSQMWIPTTNINKDYQEYLEWEAIDGNTIAEAD